MYFKNETVSLNQKSEKKTVKNSEILLACVVTVIPAFLVGIPMR